MNWQKTVLGFCGDVMGDIAISSRLKRFGAGSFVLQSMLPSLCALILGACPPIARAVTAAQSALQPVQPPKPYRLPDGHLNWTGFWAPMHGMLDTNIGLGGTPAEADSPFRKGLKFQFSNPSALKSPYKERSASYMRDVASGKVVDPVAACYPPGMPSMMVMIYGMELLQTRDVVAITSEWQAASRRIWLNQKSHTNADELDPTYVGESIAHWEGDKLIVDTIGIRDDVAVNSFGVMHSDKLHLTEIFSEDTPGILQDVITVDDPDAFVAPWTQTWTYRYRPDLRIREYVCLENNRNVGPKGEAVFKN